MRGNRASTFVSVLSVLLCLTGATAWALNPNLPPGSNFNLNNWYIQFPTDNGSLTCSAGDVDSATTTQLIDGYTNAPYFYTGTDGAMVFWAPINGATTSGSSYPRSELRELIATNNTGVNWIPYGTHILNAQCKVLQVAPSTESVIIGQIHAESGDALPTVKIYYDNGSVHGTVKTNSTDDGSDYDFPSVSVGLSNAITYTIELVNGLVTVVINSKTNSYNIFQSDPTYTNETQYFKAGDYCQADSCSNPSNYGARVAFYALTRYDAPSITNQPAGQSVLVGSNVTFAVGALGSPPLGYAWLLNNTPINNATNATLTIPNVQLTNAGSYTVAVTDLTGGIVTSSPAATLTVLAANYFTGSPTSGTAPLGVTFTGVSTGSVSSWSWIFGDGGVTNNLTTNIVFYTYNTAGVYSVTMIASSPGGASTNEVSNYIDVTCPTITVSPSNLPNATVSSSYSQTISASGGSGSYTDTVSAGTLPAGLSLSSGGVLSGTPTATGNSTFTVLATDTRTGCTGQRSYTLNVVCPTIILSPNGANPTVLTGGTVGTTYSQTITASGGTGPYSYADTLGTLPTGLSLSSAGVLSGTPTAAGQYNFKVTATDTKGCTGSQVYRVTMTCPTITLSPISLPNGTVDTSYGTQTVSAGGGTGPYTFAVTSGTLPAGLSLNGANGQITGTPTSPASQTFTVTATDNNGCTGSQPYTVTPVCPTITLTPAAGTLATGTVGTAYSQTFAASGANNSFTYSETAGALPTGLSLSPGGVLSGTPSASGVYNFTVTATDSSGCAISQPYNVPLLSTNLTVNAEAAECAYLTDDTPGASNYLDVGDLIEIGAFTNGAPTVGSSSLANFVVFGTGPINNGAGSFYFSVSGPATVTFEHQQIYVVAFNAPTVTAATQVAIFDFQGNSQGNNVAPQWQFPSLTDIPASFSFDIQDMIANPCTTSTVGNAGAQLVFGSFGTDPSGPYNNIQTAPILAANFSASPTKGAVPLSVNFTDHSSGSITSWAWAFGDGNTSISQNPSDIYVNPGVYTVQEIVSGLGGSSTDTVVNLISVYDPFAWWQLQYFGSTNNNNANTAPGGDYTGTGMSNTNKFLAGFNPTNAAAYLHVISIATTNTTDMNVIYLGANGDSTWSPGIASRTNVLEFTAGEASGGYSNDFTSTGQTNILSGGTGTGIVTNMVDAGGATNTPSRYYRVRVLVP
ncbi:MAG: putative Ig domain-containing protein [Verrucomicrobiia bacterium]|jgi:PKD repeat protein